MAYITMLNRISIDGYFATENPDTWGMDWFVQDPLVDAAAHQLHDPARESKTGAAMSLILGQETYLGFESSWVPILENPDAPKSMKAIAQELTDMRKIVFAKDIHEVTWANTELHDGNLIEFVRTLKEESDEDILILGSGTIVQQLTREKLIDYYAFITSPVIAGGGKPLFKDIERQIDLELISTQSFESGNVLLYYKTK